MKNDSLLLNPQGVNPHHWRKYKQAENNALRSLNFVTCELPSVRRWDGTKSRGKNVRRCNYWRRIMSRHLNKIFDENTT